MKTGISLATTHGYSDTPTHVSALDEGARTYSVARSRSSLASNASAFRERLRELRRRSQERLLSQAIGV